MSQIEKNKLCLLIVDDQIINITSMQEYMKFEEDFDIHYVTTSSQALIETRSLKPSVILLDILLRDASDYRDTIRELLEISPDSRIVGICAVPDIEFVNGARQAGACSFVSKHDTPQDVIDAIRAARSQISWESSYVEDTRRSAPVNNSRQGDAALVFGLLEEDPTVCSIDELRKQTGLSAESLLIALRNICEEFLLPSNATIPEIAARIQVAQKSDK
jgi:DNA-binding NarL/FixJ family response regulator